MQRRQLFEFMDLPGLPPLLRDNLTEQLRAIERVFPIFGAAGERIEALLPLASQPRVVDLCSGAGGPAPEVVAPLIRRGACEELLLTDLFPNQRAIEATAGEGVRYLSEPVDATALPPTLGGVRTVFNAFHHLPPPLARAVLADAARCREPILVVEALSRDLRGLLIAEGAGLLGPLLALFTPPWRLDRLLLNTALPIVPLMLLWEGAVSAQRCYTPAELLELTEGLDEGYAWEIGSQPVGPVLTRLNWLVGRPTG